MFEVYNLPQDKWEQFQKGKAFRFPDDYELIAYVDNGDIYDAYEATKNVNYEEFLAGKQNNWYDHEYVNAVIPKRGSWFGTVFKDMVSTRYHLWTISNDHVEISKGDIVSMRICGFKLEENIKKIRESGQARHSGLVIPEGDDVHLQASDEPGNLYTFLVHVTFGSDHIVFRKLIKASSKEDFDAQAGAYVENLIEKFDGYHEEDDEWSFRDGDYYVSISDIQMTTIEEFKRLAYEEALIPS